MLNILNEPSAPAYSRLKQELVFKISAGQWKPGDQLPPERQLAEHYKLSVGTVRNAMMQLVKGGYCYRIQGKGTFVAEYPTDQAVFYRTRGALTDNDAAVLPCHVRREELPAPDEVAQALNLNLGTPCIAITRGLNGRDESGIFPMGWSTSYFSPALCSSLLSLALVEFQKISLYHLVEQACGIPSVFCDELIQLGTLPTEGAKFLGRSENTPCFDLRMISYTYSRTPFEFRYSWILSEHRGIMRKHDFRQ